jgi:hypothetical protein
MHERNAPPKAASAAFFAHCASGGHASGGAKDFAVKVVAQAEAVRAEGWWIAARRRGVAPSKKVWINIPS